MGSFTLLHWACLLLALVSAPAVLLHGLALAVHGLRQRFRPAGAAARPGRRQPGALLLLHALTLVLFGALLQQSGAEGLALGCRLAGCITVLWAIGRPDAPRQA